MDPKNLAHAKKFLAAVHEAMENTEALTDSVRDHDDDGPPLLCRDYHSYRDAIDPEKFEKLQDLVYFLCEALFGEDCDADSIIRFSLVHLGTHENLLPHWRIPRVDDVDDSLEDRYRNWELIQNVADSAQAKADLAKKCLDEDLKDLVRQDARRRAAEDCERCEGKGWVETCERDVEGFYYGIYCENWGIGAGRNGPFRLPCECQSERDLNGWPLEKAPRD